MLLTLVPEVKPATLFFPNFFLPFLNPLFSMDHAFTLARNSVTKVDFVTKLRENRY